MIDVLFINPGNPKKIYQDLSKRFSAIEPPTWSLLLAESCRSKKFKVDVPSLISHPREIWGIQTPPAVPATFYINPNGEIVKSLFRPQTKDSLNEILYSLQKGA